MDVRKKFFSPEDILTNIDFIKEIEELKSHRVSKIP